MRSLFRAECLWHSFIKIIGWQPETHSKYRSSFKIARDPLFRRFWLAQEASLLPTIALSLMGLFAASGLVIDLARVYYARDVLQKALDSAGLAAGHAIDPDDMTGDAQQFFNNNIRASGQVSRDASLTLTVSEDEHILSLQAQAVVDMTFLKLLGYDAMTIHAASEITRETRGMELALVMDNTGSMRGTKITGMKNAASELIEALYGDEDSHPNLWVSLIPYTATVNIGPENSSWLTAISQDFLTGPTASASDNGFYPTSWKGCVMARTGTGDRSDAPPDDDPLIPYFWADSTDNDWIKSDGSYSLDETNNAQNEGRGPNLGCGPAITPLISSKAAILAGINEMLPWHRGGTTSNLGLVWGWRTISPDWRGLWTGAASPELPLDYDAPLTDKVVVILTDGQNSFYDHNGGGPDGSDFTAYNRRNIFGYFNDEDLIDEINGRFASLCETMKQEGILIYTVTFGSTPNNDTKTLYETCASKPAFYFHAASNSILSAAFNNIGRQLSNLRLSE